MSLKAKRFLSMAMVLCVLTQASLYTRGARADGEAKPFEAVAEYVLRNTEAGESLVSRLNGTASRQVSDTAFRSFAERLRWKDSAPLRSQVQTELTKIQNEFEEFRTKNNKNPKLAPGEELSPEERDFLTKASESLRSNAIEDLLKEQLTFVDAYVGPRSGAPGRGTFRDNAEAFVKPATPEGEIPARVDPDSVAFSPDPETDLRKLQLNWWKKLFMRVRAMRGFVGTIVLGEGDWRNLFMQSGKAFTGNDLATIRKYTRLLDGLNDYSRLRLVVRAAANEPRSAVTRLMTASAAATKEFEAGDLTIEGYIKALKANGKNLPLNDVVYEAYERILTVIERCTALGGGSFNGMTYDEGEVVIAERNVKQLEEQLAKVNEEIVKAKTKGDSQKLRQELGARDLTLQRLDAASRVLGDKSLELATNRDLIEIFANWRLGKINSEIVEPQDLADIFVVSQAQLDGWQEIYERSFARSINQMFKDEITLAMKAQIGETRSVVRSLNKLTQQVDGRLFTDTQVGQDLEDYAEHHLVAVIKRLGALVGVTVPPAVAEHLAHDKVKKFFDSIFNSSDDAGDHGSAGGNSHGNGNGSGNGSANGNGSGSGHGSGSGSHSAPPSNSGGVNPPHPPSHNANPNPDPGSDDPDPDSND